jgi:general secretion pathway protein A
MYLNIYQFKKEPFQITPDPEFLFLSPSHKEAMASIIYGIEGKKGFVAIVGGVGVGKTTILRSYLEKVNRERLKIIYIFNANVSFASLLKTMYQDLGLIPKTDDVFLMVNQLHEALIDEYKKGFNVVLIIDEAQNMPIETLENLRMLSNLETATEKLVQIVLIGQSEFDEMLNQYQLRQLKQRIAIRAMILPLTKEESVRYIEHRLSKVMTKEETIFTRGALKEIVTRSKGIPRVINVLCDNALITGYGYQKKPVTAKIVKEIGTDFEQKKKETHSYRWKPAAAAALVMAVGAGFWAFPFKGQIRDQIWNQVSVAREAPVTARADVKPVLVPPAKQESLPARSEPVKTDNVGIEPIKQEPARSEQVKGPLARPEPARSEQAQAEPVRAEPVRAEPVRAEPVRAEPVRAEVVPETKSQAAGVSSRKQSFVARVVEKGDTLSRLILKKYGFYDASLLDKVRSENPGIKDVNRIYIGDTIVFPEPYAAGSERK